MPTQHALVMPTRDAAAARSGRFSRGVAVPKTTDEPARQVLERPGGPLAYTTWGTGLPLLRVPGWWSHQGLLAQQPQERAFAAALAARDPAWMQVSYDAQGTGLSTPVRADFSLTSLVAELADLVDHLRLPRVTLLCHGAGGFAGIAYTARYPDRVSQLILVNAAARGAHFHVPAVLGALHAVATLSAAEWELLAGVLTQLLAAAQPADPPLTAAVPLRSAGLDSLLGLWAAYRSFDLTALLPRLTVPTLVLHSRADPLVHFAAGVELAAAIPGAQLHLVDGADQTRCSGPAAPDMRTAILRCLSGQSAEAAAPSPTADVRLTYQQLQVLHLIAAGKSSREIAVALALSARTVQRHITGLYAKIGVRNRAEATAFALQLLQ